MSKMNSSAENPKLNNFQDFLRWERSTKDTMDVKRCYIDMTNDLVAGIVLSQIVYWHLLDKNGHTKLRVKKQKRYWIARSRNDWWEECRVTARQLDRAINILKGLKIIHVGFFRFNGLRTMHIALNKSVFVTRLNHILSSNAGLTKSKQRHNSSSSKGNAGVADMSTPLTESTNREYVPNNKEEYIEDGTNYTENFDQDFCDALKLDDHHDDEDDDCYAPNEDGFDGELLEEAEGIDGDYTDTAIDWHHSQEEMEDLDDWELGNL